MWRIPTATSSALAAVRRQANTFSWMAGSPFSGFSWPGSFSGSSSHVLIGTGIPLFGAIEHDIALTHIMTRAYPSGLVTSEYRLGRRRRRNAAPLAPVRRALPVCRPAAAESRPHSRRDPHRHRAFRRGDEARRDVRTGLPANRRADRERGRLCTAAARSARREPRRSRRARRPGGSSHDSNLRLRGRRHAGEQSARPGCVRSRL